MVATLNGLVLEWTWFNLTPLSKTLVEVLRSPYFFPAIVALPLLALADREALDLTKPPPLPFWKHVHG